MLGLKFLDFSVLVYERFQGFHALRIMGNVPIAREVREGKRAPDIPGLSLSLSTDGSACHSG